jgi:aconitate hydratase
MGVIPLQLQQTVESLNLNGDEIIEIIGLNSKIAPKQKLHCKIGNKIVEVIARVDTEIEIEYLTQGGIMQYVIGKNFQQ